VLLLKMEHTIPVKLHFRIAIKRSVMFFVSFQTSRKYDIIVDIVRDYSHTVTSSSKRETSIH
jgi:hypothetical protein